MSDTPDDELPDPADPGALLLARIVERQALPADYDAFASLARRMPAHWDELLLALRDDDALRLALDDELQPAERVGLPSPLRASGGGLRAWSGWLAAAALALVWASAELTPPGAAPTGWQVPLAQGPAEAGRAEAPGADMAALDPVLAELPSRLLGTRPADDGSGFDVLYLQPVLRRARVANVIGLGADEFGRPAPVPVDPAALVRHETF